MGRNGKIDTGGAWNSPAHPKGGFKMDRTKTKQEAKNNGCSYGKVTRARLENLEEMFVRFLENDFKELKEDVKSVSKDIKEDIENLKEHIDKFRGRPTWAVTSIITVLSSACVGLVMLLLRMVGS